MIMGVRSCLRACLRRFAGKSSSDGTACLRACLRRFAGKSSSDGTAMQSRYRLSARSLSRQPQNCLTGRFADSQTDGLELLSPRVVTRQSHCGTVPTLDLGSIWEEATPILGDVFLSIVRVDERAL